MYSLIRKRLKKYKENQFFFEKKGSHLFAVDGRKAEITVDLVLQARAKMCDNKVNGPDDAVASEMIKHLPSEKIYTITRCF